MRAEKFFVPAVIVFIAAAAPQALGQAAAVGEPVAAVELIARLGDPEPQVREQALDALKKLGDGARPQLEAAAREGPVSVRLAARALLDDMIWNNLADPIQIRDLLQNYRGATTDRRIEILSRIASFGIRGHSPLIRVMQYETDDQIGWSVAGLIDPTVSPLRDSLLKLDPEQVPAPLLVQIALAHFDDRAKHRELVTAAVSRTTAGIDAQHGDYFLRAADIAAGMSRDDGEIEAELTVRREVLRAIADPESKQTAANRILAVHLRAGPTPAVGEDLALARDHLATPAGRILLAALRSKLAPELATTIPELSTKQVVDALDADVDEGSVTIQLNELGLTDLACEIIPMLVARTSDPRTAFQLQYQAFLFRRKTDPAAAITRLEALKKEAAELGSISFNADAEIEWRRAQIAHHAGDRPAFDVAMEKLSGVRVDGGHAIQQLAPMLDEQGRRGEADALIDKVAEEEGMLLQQRRRNDESMRNAASSHNTIAWLLGRSGRRLEDARKHGRAAVKIEPRNAAFLDTLAEAEFRLGNAGEAIRLETRALFLLENSETEFMQQQLVRFRAGLKPGDSDRALVPN